MDALTNEEFRRLMGSAGFKPHSPFLGLLFGTALAVPVWVLILGFVFAIGWCLR